MADVAAFEDEIGRLVARQLRRERALPDADGARDAERAAAVAAARAVTHRLFRAAATGAVSGAALRYTNPGTDAQEPAVLVLSWSWGRPDFDRALEFHFEPDDGTVAWRIAAGAAPSDLCPVDPDAVDEAFVRDAIRRLIANTAG